MSIQTSNKSRSSNNSNNSKNKTKNNNKYNYCNLKEYIEQNCYKNYLYLKPSKKVNNSTLEETKKEESILLTSKTIKSKNKVIDFILDSRATIHTCYIKELFTSINPTTTTIK